MLLSDEYKPGMRVRVTQQIKFGKGVQTATIEGEIVRFGQSINETNFVEPLGGEPEPERHFHRHGIRQIGEVAMIVAAEQPALGLTDFEEIAAFLLDQGTGAVILTLGRDGAMYRDAKGQAFNLPSYAIDVVCTCGCGDCFNAGFATGLHLGRGLEDCVRLGQASSAQNAMGLGSQAVVQDLAQTLKFMEATPTR